MNAYRRIVERASSGEQFASGLVLSAEGSTPREAGVRAIIDAKGRIEGTLGGGAAEAEAQRAAIVACRDGRPTVVEVALTGITAASEEPICGGSMRILIDPTAGKDAEAYVQAADAVRDRSRGVLVTILRRDSALRTEALWVPEGGIATDTWRCLLVDAEAIQACLKASRAVLLQGRNAETGAVWEALVEPVVPGPQLLIVGGGHVGQALAVQATLVGFAVTVLDDRREFADPALFPDGATTRCCDVAEELAAHPLGPDTYVVIVTRGHQHDAEALRACIRKPAAYIGMIGSRRKVAVLRGSFVESGWATDEEFGRIYAPIGLDIGAETVPEIAASIVAQLIAVRRRGSAPTMPKDGAMG